MAIRCLRQILIIFVLLHGGGLFPSGRLLAQGTSFNYFYRVYFRDKGSGYNTDKPATALLSPRAIARRQKAGITVPDFTDLPVNRQYLNYVTGLGYTLHCTSHWMNTGLFKTMYPADINQLLNLPFVSDVRIVKRPAVKGTFVDKLSFETYAEVTPSFDNPVIQLKGDILHNEGLTGKGILIAVLDGGFTKADLISSLSRLRARKGIIAARDFVSGGNTVYSYHYHGTAVLSVLAGQAANQIEGSSPDADFCLIRTEDTSSEFPVEEDYWAAGAEFADSIGADIISSSLGYFKFDDSSMDYKFSDMNGRTTFVTRAAEYAASKGILVVSSAGNERTSSWLRIIAPADGDSVLSAGAVDGDDIISLFSSAGPSADGRIKPDNVAQGVSVPVQIEATTFVRANGTSFSCPLLSGICACAMQAVPQALNTDIIAALHEYGDKSSFPDSLYGYGLPDMAKVIESLENKYVAKPGVDAILGPNPFTVDIKILFKEPPGSLEISIYSLSGAVIVRRNYRDYVSRILEINDLTGSNQGLYIIKLRTSEKVLLFKVIKINK